MRSAGLHALAASVVALTVAGSAHPSPPGSPSWLDSPSQVLQDPSFEAGHPNPYWSEWSSTGDPAITEDAPVGPHSGMWWVWFSGPQLLTESRVEQTVVLPTGAQAELRFYLAASYLYVSGTFSVFVDSTEVFFTDGASGAYCCSYSPMIVDLSSFADGGAHTVSLRASVFDWEGFAVDDVTLWAPDPTCANPDFGTPPPTCRLALFEPPDGGTTATDPTMSWQCVNDADLYRVMLLPPGGQWLAACDTTDTSCTPQTPLVSGETYQVYVEARQTDWPYPICLSETHTFTVSAVPVADFIWHPQVPAPGEWVIFNDVSTNSPTWWSWSFGDGTQQVYLQHPAHTFAEAGTYNVQLEVGNDSGANMVTKQVTVASAPAALFTWTPRNPLAGAEVAFMDLSAGNPTSWQWSFGDGGASTEQHPSHVYGQAGTYTVSLTASNDHGSDTATRQLTVTSPLVVEGGPESPLSPPGASVAGSFGSAIDRLGNTVTVWKQAPTKAGGVEGSIGQLGEGIFGRLIDPQGEQGEVFPVETGAGAEVVAPTVSTSADGGFVVGWEKSGTDGGVFGRVFDPGQTPLGDPFRLDDGTGALPEAPQVASSSGGDFLVAWRQGAAKQGTGGVFGRTFQGDGTPADMPERLDGGDGGQVSTPAVGSDAVGNRLVVWHQRGAAKQGADGIFGRLVNPTGEPQGEPFEINSDPSGAPSSPAVATAAGGDSVVVWTQDLGLGEGWDIFARRVGRGGQTLGAQVKVNTEGAGAQTRPTVAVNAVGDFAVAWESGPSGSKSIFGRVFGADGHALGPQFEIAAPSGSGFPEQPRLTLQALDKLTAVYARTDAMSRTLVSRQFSVQTSPGSCDSGPETLCLNGSRFSVQVAWRDFEGNTGAGRAVPLTGDTGYFWFFTDSNVELVIKVLDGRWLNDHYWVFYGALSNVDYTITVTDVVFGNTVTYHNPSGTFASVGDTSALPGTDVGPTHATRVVRGRPGPPFALPPSAPSHPDDLSATQAGTCVPGPTVLCLDDDRFMLEVSWRDFQGTIGIGNAVPLTEDTGYFWFFTDSNVELIVKVLDGRWLNGHYWVFYGALSNVEYTLTVTDTVTGQVRAYLNPLEEFGSVGDTAAFPAP